MQNPTVPPTAVMTGYGVSSPATRPSYPTVLKSTAQMDQHQLNLIQPQHQRHAGPWLITGAGVTPIAGFWITLCARSLDTLLAVLTFGIYGIVVLSQISKGRQTLAQKFLGVRTVRAENPSNPPSFGQVGGLAICTIVLASTQLIIVDYIVQAFTEKKQGLGHMLCKVMHVEERHYGAGRGVLAFLIYLAVVVVLMTIAFSLLALTGSVPAE